MGQILAAPNLLSLMLERAPGRALSCSLPHPSIPPSTRRPTVSGADDTSNFEDYSELEPMQHAFQLSTAEQALFAEF